MTRRIPKGRALLAVLALALPLAAPPARGAAPEEVKRIGVTLEDRVLVNQDGRKVRFRSDVVGDRVTVLIPFYTTCTTSYPILVYTFTRLQELLGERLGKEVVLVSVSVDPRTDIPIRLKDFARRQRARPGWVFLTGDKTTLTMTLYGIGILFSQNLEDHNHTPFTIVGSARGEWKRFYGFPSPEMLLAQVDTLLSVPEEGGR